MTTTEVKGLRISDKIKTLSLKTSSFSSMPIMKVMSYRDLNTSEESYIVITRKGIEDFASYVYAITRGIEGKDYFKFKEASKCSKYVNKNLNND